MGQRKHVKIKFSKSLRRWAFDTTHDDDGLFVCMRVVEKSMEYIPCRVEVLYPNTDWEVTWRRCRISGLGSELTSFL